MLAGIRTPVLSFLLYSDLIGEIHDTHTHNEINTANNLHEIETHHVFLLLAILWFQYFTYS